MITVEKLEKGTYFNDAFKISFRYDPTTVAKVKELAERRYLPEDRAWEIPAHELPALIEKVGLSNIKSEEAVVQALNTKEIEDKREATQERLKGIKPVRDFDFKTAPLPHQIEAFNYGMEKNSLLIGDEQGLGKTKESKVNEPIEAEKVTEAIESTPEVTEEPETATEEAEELSVIYADDEEINLYLNRYNEANVGQEITADQFEPYKHHGSVHKNQIKFKTEETTISATGTKVTVYLEYKDLEQYKEAFLRFVKPFSDTDIEKCWEQVLADDTRVIEFDGFSTETSKFNGNIEYMSIYGFIE